MRAPDAMPPRATTWWQPAQWSVKRRIPFATLPRSGCGCGTGGPEPNDAT